MRIPPALIEPVTEVLRATAGDTSTFRGVFAVGGGCINQVACVETERGRYLLKWNVQPLPKMFLREADGLTLLRATNTVRVPVVFMAADMSDDHPAYIVLEWIEKGSGSAQSRSQAQLGMQLAALHRESAVARIPPLYGLEHDNYLGSTPQYNNMHTDWITFFREQRLRPQIDLAQQNGLLSGSRRQRLEQLLERVDTWLGRIEHRPSLLHGDLWGGNVLVTVDGSPVLIDPAISYGDREAELAYTELFGGFSRTFYQAYHEVWPIAPDYVERRDLYNLYHLLNHLNIFGSSYAADVDRVLARYL